MSTNNNPLNEKDRKFFAVEASAGSGKTEALVKRYLKLLLDPQIINDPYPFKNILAITYTNKAADEMKDRIISQLKMAALGGFENKNRAVQILEAIFEKFDHFRVQTIDSLMNAMLMSSSLKLGMTPAFRIDKKFDELILFSMDELIEGSLSEKKIKKLFDRFIHQYLYVANKGSWYIKKEIFSAILTMYHDKNHYGRSFIKNGKDTSKIVLLKQKLIADAKIVVEADIEGMNKRNKAKIENFLVEAESGFSTDRAAEVFNSDSINMNKGYKAPAACEKAWSEIRKILKTICAIEAFSTFDPYIDIYENVIENLDLLQKKEDLFFLEELSLKASGLFVDGQSSIEEIYCRLATRFKHYLIDEFQDTNRLQWENIYPMVEDALSAGGSLFYVGDKKQAIFRFRGGDAMLFDTVPGLLGSMIEDKSSLLPVMLTTNYRSDKTIVEYVNSVFSNDNLKSFADGVFEKYGEYADLLDEESVLFNFKAAKQEMADGKSEGFVSVEVLEKDKDGDEEEIIKEKVLTIVKDIEKRFERKDIAVICRENDEVELVSNWLIEQKIPVESEKTLNIGKDALIKEMISLLKFLDSPVDDISFASFITGDIFSSVSSLSRDEMRSFLIGAKDNGYLYINFQKQYPLIWKKIFEKLFKKANIIPLYEYLTLIFNTLNVLERFPGSQAYLMKLFEIVISSQAEICSIGDFIKYFDEMPEAELYIKPVDSDSVKVLTIHKSKGLGFDAVIVPFLSIDASVGGRSNQRPYIIDVEDKGINLVRTNKKRLGLVEKADKIYFEEFTKELTDELNACYVALTRARHELHVIVPSSGRSKNAAIDLIKENFSSGVKSSHDKDTHAAVLDRSSAENKLPISKLAEFSSMLKDEHLSLSRLSNRKKITEGEIVHFILSKIGNLYGIKDVESVLSKAADEAKIKYPNESIDVCSKIVSKLLEKKTLKEFFFTKDGVVSTEKDIVSSNGMLKRLDRLIETDDSLIIVDFKLTGEENSKYYEQVRDYMDTVKDLYPDKKVRGFLIYTDIMEAEEVK